MRRMRTLAHRPPIIAYFIEINSALHHTCSGENPSRVSAFFLQKTAPSGRLPHGNRFCGSKACKKKKRRLSRFPVHDMPNRAQFFKSVHKNPY